MPITPVSIAPPNPSTQRGQASHLAYDAVNDRLAYANGKSVIVRPADFKSNFPIVVFSKHIHPVTAVKFSPSGFYIASGDASGQIKIWDSAPKKSKDDNDVFEAPVIKSEFHILSGPIKSIAWDSDNSRIIAVGQGKEKFGHAFTWDSGNSIGDIQGHSSTINAVDIKPQRPYRAATVGDDFALVFFQGPPFKFDKSLRGNHSNVARDVKFSPNGDHLVSVGSDRTICFYQGKTGEFVKKIELAHEGGIFAVAWFPDSEHFVTASADGSLKKWTKEGKEVQKYEVEKKPSVLNQQVGLVIGKEYIISLSVSGDLNYFSNDGVELIKVIKGHQHPITKIVVEGSDLYSGSSDGVFLKQGLSDCNILPEPLKFGTEQEQHTNYLVDIVPDEGVQYTVGWDDSLKKWETGAVQKSVKLPGQPKQLLKIPSSGLVVLFEKKILFFDNDLKLLNEQDLSFSTSSATIFGDNLWLTNVSANTIVEFSIASDTKVTPTNKLFPTLRSPPTLVKASPDGKYLAVADSTGKYTLFDSEGKTVTTRWAFHTSKVFDAQWTKDSKYLLSAGLDSGIIIYSVEKPSKVIKFPLAHSSGVSSLSWYEYDPEKKTGSFLSGGLDATIKMWNVEL